MTDQQQTEKPSKGQIEYEIDVQAYPLHFGTPRKKWADLQPFIRMEWEAYAAKKNAALVALRGVKG